MPIRIIGDPENQRPDKWSRTEQEEANVRCSQKCFAVKHAVHIDQRV